MFIGALPLELYCISYANINLAYNIRSFVILDGSPLKCAITTKN